jgi:septum formation protein
MKIVLASQSPRRRELMSQAGYDYEVLAPDESAECGIRPGETTTELVARYARQKALDVAPKITCEAIIIACDTVADLHGAILGKPLDRSDAERMLRMLSGQKHSVLSGLCVWRLPTGEPQVRVAVSELEMAELSESQIGEYLDSGQWMGKSGAFGYQDGHPWLRLVSGTASNVVGLPLDLLQELMSSVVDRSAIKTS